ncbi:Hypothetical predicted protein, partial [Marmota monax]
PQYGGKFCPGSGRVYQLCNMEPCNKNSLDFRAQQCAEYNSKPFRGWFYQWKPYTKVEEEDRCKLYCKAENFEFFFAMSGKVKDGTPCSPHKNDVCIDGICEPVGCDHELGSKAVLDACGVCKGDNSTCKFYKGLYLNQHKANEYYPVVVIPAGARSIEIQELQVSSSYLAVRSLSQKYYLTGGWSIDWPGDFSFAGTTFEYQRSFNQPERLYAPGPTNETLVFECSATCGLGVRKRDLKCSEKTFQGKLVTFPERRCRNIKKPNLDLEETCNRRACPVYNTAAECAQSPAGEGCRPAPSTVFSKATLPPVVRSTRSHQCSEPATQTFVQRLKNEVKGTAPVSSTSLWRICHKLTLFGGASRVFIALWPVAHSNADLMTLPGILQAAMLGHLQSQ